MIIRSTRVVLRDGVRGATVHVSAGRIERVGAYDDVPEGAAVEDVGDAVVMAGVVDTHVHVNEPGRTDWEGFATATRAAAAGGVTTIVDMPLNSIPATTSVAAIEAKRAAAEGKCWIDVGLAGGLVPANAGDPGELRAMREAGIVAFKCFLVDSGVPEFAHVGAPELRAAMPVLADIATPLLVHAEVPAPIEAVARAFGEATAKETRKYARYLASRPRLAEDEAVALLYSLCRELGARTHIVHLSSASALPLLRAAKDASAPLSAETCPHYLFFAAEDVKDGDTRLKCAPPIRERVNNAHLWDALREGLLDLVVSDHSPCTPELKKLGAAGGSFREAWGGIASVGLSLPVVWTRARALGHGIEAIAKWMCEEPAKLVGLWGHKGAIDAGFDADLVVWRPEETWRVDAARVEHRNKLTPYDGYELAGVVEQTYLRGEKVVLTGPPRGRTL